MSVHIASQAWRLRLAPAQKLVLLKLADCADDGGGNAYPSVARLAAECCMSARTVQRMLRELQTTGLISIQVEHDRGHHRPTTYRIHPERGDNPAPREPERGDNLAPHMAERGDTGDASGVTPVTQKQAIHLKDPSLDPSLMAGTDVPAPPLQPRLANGRSGPDLAPLFEAFTALQLPRPLIQRGEGRAAQSLLRHFSAEQIAACWQDAMAGGEFWDAFAQRDLSFDYLANRNRLGNWLHWREGKHGRITNGAGRPGRGYSQSRHA